MTAISGIWNNTAASGASPIALKPTANSGSSTSQASSSSTIGANDFLTLLVTEMKNQDPTATTDPNEYVNQLVSVNSLQQLIQINETLGAAVYAGAGGSTSSNATPNLQAGLETQRPDSASSLQTVVATATPSHLISQAPGNLAIPATNPAAISVA
jgi:flagellar basal-body rod modification protein FlgD